MNRRGNFKRKSKIIRGKATQLQNIKEKRKNKVNIQENERTNNKKICKYFLQGKCTFQNCQFLHIHPQQNLKKNKTNNDKTINNGNSTQIINNTNDNLDSSKEDVNNEDLDDLNINDNKKVEEDKEEEGEIKEKEIKENESESEHKEGEIKEKDDSEHEEEHDDEEKLEEEKENIENNEINEEEKELSTEEIETAKEIETTTEIETAKEIDETSQIKEKEIPIIVTYDKSIQTDEINDRWGSTFGLSISFAVPKYSFSNPSIPNSWNLSNGAPLFGKPTSQNKEEQKRPNVYNDILLRKSIIISF